MSEIRGCSSALYVGKHCFEDGFNSCWRLPNNIVVAWGRLQFTLTLINLYSSDRMFCYSAVDQIISAPHDFLFWGELSESLIWNCNSFLENLGLIKDIKKLRHLFAEEFQELNRIITHSKTESPSQWLSPNNPNPLPSCHFPGPQTAPTRRLTDNMVSLNWRPILVGSRFWLS